ncbi:nitrilase-related carbon-nitrogen hydrolase [Caballeronia insecticola]|uniref:Putative carbon-nitrogen hydrolase n=1 Tax=Caballeronia insecticola TaxID=758793 RepID=R4WXL5_9BURK|nr:nitrilase-related carbon-nitrogen hydrolase [Caballeronia insecticola]BAN22767.1 putative carbon-nitrogen hydrolase [Caballeronia insecticola]
MDATSFRVAVIAFESQPGDAARNCVLIADELARAATLGVQLAVFPQSCIGGHDTAHAEAFDGPSIDAIAAAVDKTGVAAGVGWIERAADGRLYDSYAVCFARGARVRHRKLHATHGALHGGNRFTVFDTPFGVRVGILIGGDNDVVENVRMTALMGATLLIAPMSRAASRRATLAARAADNGMYIAYAHPSCDESMIVGPDGRVLARSNGARDGCIVAQVKPALAEANSGRRALAARRPDLYEPLTRQGHAFPLAIETERVQARGALPLSFAIVGRNRTAS